MRLAVRRRLLVIALLLVPAIVHAQTASQIVEAADKVRNPQRPFSLQTVLTEFRSAKPQDQMVLTVFSKVDGATGQFRSLIRFDEPPRDLGKLMLKTGNILWFYDPASKASVRMSPQERLLGQASNGDVVTVNYAKDYQARIGGEEVITDADRQSRDTWRLELSAADDSVTYFRIDYWVEKGTFRPVKGKFYSDSGRLLKTAYFHKYEDQLGGVRPTETIIIDGVDAQLVTRMTYGNYQARDIPEPWFQRDFLARLKTD
jgi:outer membrane lipoprotein-sorting protein